MWTAKEVEALKRGVEAHGVGFWEQIRSDPQFEVLRCAGRAEGPGWRSPHWPQQFGIVLLEGLGQHGCHHRSVRRCRGRTGVQLKDKWRNIVKFQRAAALRWVQLVARRDAGALASLA